MCGFIEHAMLSELLALVAGGLDFVKVRFAFELRIWAHVDLCCGPRRRS